MYTSACVCVCLHLYLSSSPISLSLSSYVCVCVCMCVCVCSRGNVSCCVLEQYGLLHRLGSSHGESRIVRKAYPSELYTSLMNECWPLWEKLQERAGTRLIRHTRGLDIARKDTDDIHKLIRTCAKHGVTHEVLTVEEARNRYPGLHLPEDYIAVQVEDAGAVHATRTVNAFQQLARQAGVTFLEDEGATDIVPDADGAGGGGGVTITTAKGNVIVADKVIITAGAWTKQLLSRITGTSMSGAMDPIHTTTAYWRCKDDTASRLFSGKDGTFPVVIDYTGHQKLKSDGAGEDEAFGIYLIPVLEYPGLIKVCHHGGPPVPDPSTREVVPGANELEKFVKPWLRRFLPDVDETSWAMAEGCMYTVTPTADFVLDTLPAPYDNITIGGGFSGHGFKFAPIIGEILVDLALEGASKYDVSNFTLDRVIQSAKEAAPPAAAAAKTM